jgi:hypothetical protein
VRRRSFVLGLGTLVVGTGRLSPRQHQAAREMDFLVAGVRFSSAEVAASTFEGDRVTLRHETFGVEGAYVVCVRGGALGFVPSRMVPIIESVGVESAFVSRADRAAVPWKQFQVTVRFAAP